MSNLFRDSDYLLMDNRSNMDDSITSDRERAEVAEARLDTVLCAIVDAFVLIDQKGTIHRFNQAAERIFGYNEAEVLGKNVNMLMPKRIADHHDQYIDNYVKTREAKIIGIGRQVEAQRKDGTHFSCELSVGEVRGSDNHFFVGILRDITDRLKMERESQQQRETLAHVSRVNIMGEMAAGIAHELNQPLTAISNYATAGKNLLGRMTEDQSNTKTVEPLQKVFQKVSEQAVRAGDIIRKLRDFVAKHDPTSERTTMSNIINEVTDMLSTDSRLAEIKYSIQSETLSQPSSQLSEIEIEVDIIQIQQVLLNLIRNALDATEHVESGEVTVSIEESNKESSNNIEQRMIIVKVSDNGVGLSDELAQTIFTPFTTTKATGLGMGLAISNSIINAHGGTLSFQNQTTGGACFQFSLPAAKNTTLQNNTMSDTVNETNEE